MVCGLYCHYKYDESTNTLQAVKSRRLYKYKNEKNGDFFNNNSLKYK